MTPNGNTPNTKAVTRTVFDLTAFDDVKLTKTMTLPTKPTSIEEALAVLNNDKSALLDVIYEGLVGKAQDAAYADINGFQVIDEDGKPGDLYVRDVPKMNADGTPAMNEDGTPIVEHFGKYADEETGKKINAAVLALAKIQGYDKTLAPAKKNELKEKAMNFLRSNPAMLESIQK